MNKLILLILFLNTAIFPAQANLQVEICGKKPILHLFLILLPLFSLLTDRSDMTQPVQFFFILTMKK